MSIAEGASPAGAWKIREPRGSVAARHALVVPDGVDAEVWLHQIEARTLVLGSSQRIADDAAARAAAMGLDVAVRASGGGAVLLDELETIWVDVVIGRQHPAWSDDVAAAFGWLGDAWVRALRSLGLPVRPHVGGYVASPQSRAVCFAGLGNGEVVVDGGTNDGQKLVGISQRRTRAGAKFQCAVLRRWSPAPWSSLVGIDPAEIEHAAIGYEQLAGGEALAGDAVVAALLASLRTTAT